MKLGLVLVLLVALLATSVAAKEPEDLPPPPRSHVDSLTPQNISLINEGNWFVMFYAPWCGHCQALHPEFTNASLSEAATTLGKGMKFGQVDCTKFDSLCQKYDVHGYPGLKYFLEGVEGPMEYKGDRNKVAIIEFVERALAPDIMTLSRRDYDAHGKEDPPRVHVTLVQPSSKTDDEALAFFRRVYLRCASLANLKWGVLNDDAVIEQGAFKSLTSSVIVTNEVVRKPFISEEPTEKKVADFVLKNRFLAVSELDVGTFGALGRLGRPLAIGVYNGQIEKSQVDAAEKQGRPVPRTGLLPELRELAKIPRYVPEFSFARLNGVYFTEWVKQLQISREDFPYFMVFDMENQIYYSNKEFNQRLKAILGRDIAITAMEDYLDRILKGEEERIPITWVGYFSIARMIIAPYVVGLFAQPWYIIVLAAAVPSTLVSVAILACCWGQGRAIQKKKQQKAAEEAQKRKKHKAAEKVPQEAHKKKHHKGGHKGGKGEHKEE